MKPMKPLLDEDANEFERKLLGSVEDEEPPPEARARAIAALGLANVPAAPDAAPSSVSAAPSSGAVAMNAVKWLLPLTLLVAGGAVITAAWPDAAQSSASGGGHAASAGEASPPASKREAQPAPVSDESDESDESETITASPTITPNALPDAPARREGGLALARAPESARPPSVVEGVRPSDDALARETALIDEARRALNNDGSARALTLLDQHDREFPSGVFHLDADVLRIEALERAGRAAEAERLAAQFLSRHSEGSYARRVRTVQDRIARSMGAGAAGAPAKEPVQ